MLAAASVGFDTDFWRRARARFPYSAAVAEEAFLPSFYLTLLENADRWDTIFRLPSVRTSLRAVYDRFARMAKSRNLHAVVALIPRNGGDRTSGLVAIAAATEQQRAHISFINVGGDFEWSSFLDCHPSPAGYHMIAADIAHIVAPLLPTKQRVDGVFKARLAAFMSTRPNSFRRPAMVSISRRHRTGRSHRTDLAERTQFFQ
jgi:hypothetical protein